MHFVQHKDIIYTQFLLSSTRLKTYNIVEGKSEFRREGDMAKVNALRIYVYRDHAGDCSLNGVSAPNIL